MASSSNPNKSQTNNPNNPSGGSSRNKTNGNNIGDNPGHGGENPSPYVYSPDSVQDQYRSPYVYTFADNHEEMPENYVTRRSSTEGLYASRNVTATSNNPHSKNHDPVNAESNGITANHPNSSFDVDTFIDTLKTRHKLNIINHALSSARKNNQKITNSRKVFEQRQKNIYKHQIHWHKKLTLAFACIIFFFIGAPLGSIIRKGGLGTPLVISVIFFIIYYIISITGENFVEKGVLPAFFGMWLSSLIFLPIGIFLTYKATNDSMILNTETYAKAIKKIISFGSFKNGKSGEDDAKNFSEQ
jgi:lipopolysaccharide export LptBFGC system permease protein LptF